MALRVRAAAPAAGGQVRLKAAPTGAGAAAAGQRRGALRFGAMARFAAALHRFVMRRAGRLAGLHVYRVMVRELAAGDAWIAVPGIELRLMKPLELLPYCAHAELELVPAALRDAQARGEGCIGALQGTQLAGYLWYAFGPAPHTRGTWTEVPQGTAYLFRTYVQPAFRGRGIATALFRRADAAFLPSPCRRALACVELHNYASAAALRSAGFRSAGTVATLQPPVGQGARLLQWRSAGAARTGFRFRATPAARTALSGRAA
jgi:ribosomal protein S18 acetylase RimI-like enzyme